MNCANFCIRDGIEYWISLDILSRLQHLLFFLLIQITWLLLSPWCWSSRWKEGAGERGGVKDRRGNDCGWVGGGMGGGMIARRAETTSEPGRGSQRELHHLLRPGEEDEQKSAPKF